MSDPCLTSTEWKRVREYDEATQRQIEAENRSPIPPEKNIFDLLREDRLEEMRFLQEDIAVLLAVRDRKSVV